MKNVLDRVPPHLFNIKPKLIHEYGCSSGEGVELLRSHFDCDVVGFDNHHTPCTVGDICTPTGQPDVIFVLHVLEGPYGFIGRQAVIVDNLLSICKLLIVSIHPNDKNAAGYRDWFPVDRVLHYEQSNSCGGECGCRPDVVYVLRGNIKDRAI
jgi:hypothetical protein